MQTNGILIASNFVIQAGPAFVVRVSLDDVWDALPYPLSSANPLT